MSRKAALSTQFSLLIVYKSKSFLFVFNRFYENSLLKVIFYAVNSVSVTLTFGTPLSPDHYFIKHFWSLVEDFEQVFSQQNIMDLFPFLEPLFRRALYFPLSPDVQILHRQIKDIVKVNENLEENVYGLMDAHQHEPEGPYPLDQVVKELKRPGYKEKPTMKPENEKRFVARDLFFASSATITDNLLWAVHILSLHQDVQEKLRTAIVELTDLECVLSTFTIETSHSEPANIHLSSPSSTKYSATAVISRSTYRIGQRRRSNTIVTQFQKDVWYLWQGGKRSTVLLLQIFSNIYAMQRNPAISPSPHKFVIDRFVSDDGLFDGAFASFLLRLKLSHTFCSKTCQ